MPVMPIAVSNIQCAHITNSTCLLAIELSHITPRRSSRRRLNVTLPWRPSPRLRLMRQVHKPVKVNTVPDNPLQNLVAILHPTHTTAPATKHSNSLQSPLSPRTLNHTHRQLQRNSIC